MKLRDIFFGSLTVSGSLLLHFPFMLIAFFLGLFSDNINDIPSLNWLTWLFFYVHLTIVLIFCIYSDLQVHRIFCKIVTFMMIMFYHGSIFYSISEYAKIFQEDRHNPNSHAEYKDQKFSPYHMKNIIQFWIIIEITVYFAAIICIAFILVMSSCYKLRLLKPITNQLQEDDSEEKNNRAAPLLGNNVEEPLLTIDGYPDDPDEYNEVAEDIDNAENDEKNDEQMDVLIKYRSKMDVIIIPFQIAAVTSVSLILASDNPQKTDDHDWYGFNLSFSLIICFILVIMIIYTNQFAAAKKRAPRMTFLFFCFFGVTILIALLNILINDGSPWSTDIRRIWATLLFAMLISLVILAIFNPTKNISKLIFFFLNLLKLSFKICIKKDHQIKAQIFEEAELIMSNM